MFEKALLFGVAYLLGAKAGRERYNDIGGRPRTPGRGRPLLLGRGADGCRR
jgi:hypothetical protein